MTDDRFERELEAGLERLGRVEPSTLARVRGSIETLPIRSAARGSRLPNLRTGRLRLAAAAASLAIVAALAFALAPWAMRTGPMPPTTPAATPTTSRAAIVPTVPPSVPPPSASERPFLDPGGPVFTMGRLDPDHGWALVLETGRTVLVVTADSGATWRDATPAASWIYPLGVDFVDADHGWVAQSSFTSAGSPFALWRTSDGGRQWQRSSPVAGQLVGAAVSFVSPAAGFLAVADGTRGAIPDLYRTADGGATWSKVATLSNPEITAGDALFHLEFLNDRDGFFTARSTTLVTHDGGLHWAPIDLPPPESANASATRETRDVVVRDGLVFVHAMFLTSGGYLGAEYVSEDAGRTWRIAWPIAQTNMWDQLAPGDASTWNGFVSGWNGHGGTVTRFATTDGGRTWSAGTAALPSGFILRKVSFADALHGWGLAGKPVDCLAGETCLGLGESGIVEGSSTMGSLVVTDDGGRTWRSGTSP